jgi:beta-glucosidase
MPQPRPGRVAGRSGRVLLQGKIESILRLGALSMNSIVLPSNLLIGAATSAYQIEGAIDNDWMEWEGASRLKVPGVRCGRGIAHLERWEEDLGLLQDLRAEIYRYSVEWSRIEPKEGEFDEGALRHYARLTDSLRRRGILPVVTLHHFTHPRWFHEKTPWESRASVEVFARFARRVVEALGPAHAYITFNEPNVLLLGGYVQGVIPPGRTDFRACALACENIVRAHAAARAVIRELQPASRVGIAHNVMRFAPARGYLPTDRLLCQIANRFHNYAIPNAMVTGELDLWAPLVMKHRAHIPDARGSLDFIGVNYYSRMHLRTRLNSRVICEPVYLDRSRRGLTDIGWEEYPQGLYLALKAFSRFGVPLWVTENGIDDRSGRRRSRFLYEHMSAMLNAIAEGVKVEAYLHWSLMDNFEWLEGFGPRFGLYRVDFDTHTREATPTAGYLRRIIETRRLDVPEVATA